MAEAASGWKRWRPPPWLKTTLGVVISVGIFTAAIVFLFHELKHVRPADVLANARAVSRGQLLGAIGLTLLSYLTLTGYDFLALKYVKRDLPYSRAAMTSFMAYAIGHNVGFSALSAGSVRYRVYSALGLSAIEIAQIIGFCTITFGLGASQLVGWAFWLMPAAQLENLHAPISTIHLIGAALALFAPLYLAWSVFGRHALRTRSWAIEAPQPRIAIAQILFALCELSFAAGVLYCLAAPVLPIRFTNFLGIYLLAIGAGLVSSVPGGVGVFEAVLLACLPSVPHAALLGPILVYRAIYYFVPLSIALVLLAGHEAVLHRTRLQRATTVVATWLAKAVPQGMSVAVFLAGVVLLVSGATPGIAARLDVVARFIPLAALELSHLIGSVLGVVLMILARGLYLRLADAHRLTIIALLAGAFVSLVKGLDYEEATILSVISALLWIARDEFHRPGSMLEQRFTTGWIANVALVLLGSLWIVLLAYRHVEFSNELWWQFSFAGDAPRSLRAELIATVVAIGFGLWKLITPAPPSQPLVTSEERALVAKILADATDSTANVALLGDKRFLFDDDRTAFIMYQVSGRSWVALGDPVGPRAAHESLVWRFRELTDRYAARPVFYHVRDDSLPLYVDMGLALYKLGEDALVPLADFGVEGSKRAELRQALSRARRDGASFEVVRAADVPALVPQLAAVSQAWLASKATAEKGFSIGTFSQQYISCFDCAVVRVGERIVAFANVWQAPKGKELSVDLMRYGDAAPKVVMDYLLTELMLWGRSQGFEWFSLGMAPLSGLEARPLAPMWHKVGRLIFRYGDDFYNFEGLRHYKEKFVPTWRPRYLACPAGLDVPRALFDATALISGGVRKILTK